jgi:hypothetical protein
MIYLEDIREGSVVVVRGGFGTELPKRVVVEEVHEEIKNGRSGIDYKESDGHSRWAYLDQVERVVKY